MNGTLHQTAHQEIAKQYQDILPVQIANPRLKQVQSKPEKPETIGYVKGLAQKARVAIVTTIIFLTVLLIALNIGAAVMDGGNNLV